MKQLDGKLAVVTGAGSGIGRATALELAQAGCDIVVVDIDLSRAQQTADLAETFGRVAGALALDVADRQGFADMAGWVRDNFRPCSILINNAGVTSAGAFMDESDADLDWIVGINIWGVVNGCRAFLPQMLAEGEGHIVNLSSMVGLLGLPHNASYSLTKGAVRSFSEALRAELVTSGVGVTAVFPGSIHTNITNSARGSEGARLAKLGSSRLAPILMRSPDSVARAIVKGIRRERARVVIGPDAHVVSGITRVIPGRSGLVGRLTNRIIG